MIRKGKIGEETRNDSMRAYMVPINSLLRFCSRHISTFASLINQTGKDIEEIVLAFVVSKSFYQIFQLNCLKYFAYESAQCKMLVKLVFPIATDSDLCIKC